VPPGHGACRLAPDAGGGDLEVGGGPGQPERAVRGVAGQVDDGKEGSAGRGRPDASDLTGAGIVSAGHEFLLGYLAATMNWM
jgi:hypothetical protein